MPASERGFIRWLNLLWACAFAWAAHGADVGGSRDYAEIGRFEGSEIASYSLENYGATVLATGPVRDASDAERTKLEVEGRITRIVYRVPPGSSALEVFRNFENRIRDAGYTSIFSGGPDVIDDYQFKYKHPVEKLDAISLSGKIWYLAAQRRGQGSDTYLSVLVSPHSGGDGQRVRLIAAETKAMEDRMVDAAAMRTAIGKTGKIALYGIYFDTNSAVVKAESGPTLEQIQLLMRGAPGLAIIVVGHTDNQGTYDHNMGLSRRRAMAVVKALTGQYGIAPARLRAAGVGYLAPAASNADAAGRAANRRVELVNGS